MTKLDKSAISAGMKMAGAPVSNANEDVFKSLKMQSDLAEARAAETDSLYEIEKRMKAYAKVNKLKGGSWA
ncbi:hypothetical protein DPM33_23585 [Mesorhizobium hawassense]|uniref:Uncharacterized protein n=1 Tax=Mesorhizobium hawassense TaxID=1209954 RepID=A0A330HKH5_9HYPH|nr:hypothetical protein [Mesorhizobium hawassense]RAZ88510.1 hypothetical protein DPM33_23585 [Mesorhizobium hawassense]